MAGSGRGGEVFVDESEQLVSCVGERLCGFEVADLVSCGVELGEGDPVSQILLGVVQ